MKILNPVNSLILIILAQTVAFAQAVWNGKADIKWYKDSQTEFTITTPEQLAGLAKLVNDGNNLHGKTIKLGANIMLNDTAGWQNWASKSPKNKWEPIGIKKASIIRAIMGKEMKMFGGTFDGNGFAVSGVYIYSADEGQGLFGYADSSAIIKNIGVVASFVVGGGDVGGLVGWNMGHISNSYSAAWVAGKYYVGGLVGLNYKATISKSYSTGMVTLVSTTSAVYVSGIGGLVGLNRHGSINGSYSTGAVVGKGNVGGLAGLNDGAINRSYSTGKVAGETYIGGLVGTHDFDSRISNCYSSGEVTGISKVGGLAGLSNSTIRNSYSTGAVTGKKDVGGIVGDNGGEINISYSAGKVTGKENVGGLVGSESGMIISGYYNKEINGQSKGVGEGEGMAEGKTTAEMQGKEFADNLNFSAGFLSMNAWIYEAGKYPALNAQPAAKSGADGLFASGDGTKDNPYVIENTKHLENLSRFVNMGENFSGKYLKLGNDIMLNDTAGWRNWAAGKPAGVNEWTPIGLHYTGLVKIKRPFRGTLDGDGFAVSGVYVNSTGNAQGLFGYLGAGGKIKKLGVTASYVKGNGDYIGGLAGKCDGTVSDSYFIGTVEGVENSTGGLAGENEGWISNSYSIATVSGKYGVGGLAGENLGTISDSYSIAWVAGEQYVGGLAGNSSGKGAISDSYFHGTVTGEDYYVGGLVGNNGNNISNSYSSGTVKGRKYVGGLAGWNNSRTISNSYSTSSVIGNIEVGGLAGNNDGVISSSYSIGAVTGDSLFGGLVGKNGGLIGINGEVIFPPGKVNGSYYNKETSRQSDAGKGNGKAAAQMKQKSTYEGWNFDMVWGISGDVNGGYPYLLSIPLASQIADYK